MRPVLIAYDGSTEADAAIAVAADLVGGGPAVVVYVAALSVPPIPVGGGGIAVPATALAVADPAHRRRAEEIAQAGRDLAQAAGFEAEALTVDAQPGTGEAILDAAVSCRARLIVLAPHGHSRLARLLLGSTSDTVTHRGAIPVLTVPGEQPHSEAA